VFAFIPSRGCAKPDYSLDQWLASLSLVGFLTICRWIVGLGARMLGFAALIGAADGFAGRRGKFSDGVV